MHYRNGKGSTTRGGGGLHPKGYRFNKLQAPAGIRIAALIAILLLPILYVAATATADDTPEVSSAPIGLDNAIEGAEGKADEIVSPEQPEPAAAENVALENIGRSESLEVLEGVFAPQLEGPAAPFQDLDEAKFITDNVALVPTDASQTSDRALLDSTVPLRSDNGTGTLEAVDLNLERTGETIQPLNPLVEVKIPNTSTAPIELPEAGVTITLGGSLEERTASISDDSSAFYPNVEPNSDLVVTPTPFGFETMTQLRSDNALHTETFHLGIPEGASVKETDAGGAIVVQAGEGLMHVSPPTGMDANGAKVSVRLEVDGTTLTLTASPSASTAYPVLIDPLFQTYNWPIETEPGAKGIYTGAEGYNEYLAIFETKHHEEWSPEVVHTPSESWFSLANNSSQNYGGTHGLFARGPEGKGTSMAGDHASWVYTVPRYYSDQEKYKTTPETYISHMVLSNLIWKTYTRENSNPWLEAGIARTNGTWASLLTHEGREGHSLTDAGYPYEFSSADPTAKFGSVGVWNLQNWTPCPCGAGASVYVGVATVELSEPATSIPKLGTPLAGPAGWINQTASPIEFSASDSGLGVYSVALTPELAGSVPTWKTQFGCTGVGGNPCPHTWKWNDAGRPPLKYEPATLPTGITKLKVVAEDPLANASTAGKVEVKVDHAAPSLALSGPITEQAKLGSSAPQYALKYSATDGDDAAASALAPFGSAGAGEGKTERPAGVAADGSGHVWVADSANNRIEEFDETGKFLRQFGSLGSTGGKLSSPAGIARTPAGSIWVSDTGNNRVEQFNEKGEFVSVIGKEVNKTKVESGGTESQKNLCTAASGDICQAGKAGSANGQFKEPKGIALTAGGNLVVVDAGNNRVQKLSSSGEYLAKFGSSGAAAGQLKEPYGVAIAADGSFWVGDAGNHRIQHWTATFELLAPIGSDPSGGTGQFKSPSSVAIAPSGHLLVADDQANQIQVFQSSGTYLRQFGSAGVGNSQFAEPRSLAIGAGGTVFVADAANHRVARWSHADQDPQSGIVKVDIKVDGQLKSTPFNQLCASKNCQNSGEWIYQASEYATGSHKVEVVTTDGVNLATTSKVEINSINDTAPPQLSAPSSLFTAPEGWVEQKSYIYNATATDAGGSGVKSMTLTIDGKVIKSVSQSCPNGGCSQSLGLSSINMATYAGGAHPAELVATDVANRTATKKWTINVNPDGTVTATEARDTLEAADDTSDGIVVAPNSEVIPAYERAAGNDPVLNSGSVDLVSSGTPDISAIAKNPSNGYSIGIPESTIEVAPTFSSASATPMSVVAQSAAVSANTQQNVDSVLRPVYDGIFSYQAIRDSTAPETYSWDVDLREGQTLKAIDGANAAIYFEDGDQALLISAEFATDAVGTNVPTSLSVSEGHVVTLKVAHKGASYVYPVVGGAAWQGGTTTEYVSKPMDETEIYEARAKREQEQHEAEESAKWLKWEKEVREFAEGKGPAYATASPPLPVVGINRLGPPEPLAPGSTDDQGASASGAHPGKVRKYEYDLCAYDEDLPGGCTPWHFTLWGSFEFNGNYAWWKPNKPHPHCEHETHLATASLEYCDWIGLNHQPYGVGNHISSQGKWFLSPGGAPLEREEVITEYMYGSGHAEGHLTSALCNPLKTC